MIGQAVFGKRLHFDTAEDSSVRVNIRQLRLKLHEYFQAQGADEPWIVSIPKGGYALSFTHVSGPSHVAEPVAPIASPVSSAPVRARWGLPLLLGIFALLAVVCATGWWHAALNEVRSVPWPLNGVITDGTTTNLVLADAGTSLRVLGDQEFTLDAYITHNYPPAKVLSAMSPDEAGLVHYLASSRLTSLADANAAAVLSSLAGRLADRIMIRSARDVNATDLTRGNFIFVGSRTSNPWVQLPEQQMNFRIVEDGSHGHRYILNRHPLAGEQQRYEPSDLATLASGDDYAVIAVLPANTGNGNWLVLEGVRMEGTNAAIALLKTEAGRQKLAHALVSLDPGKPARYFEALLHAQSVAGATMSVDVIAARLIR